VTAAAASVEKGRKCAVTGTGCCLTVWALPGLILPDVTCGVRGLLFRIPERASIRFVVEIAFVVLLALGNMPWQETFGGSILLPL
jgi:hypothetical protein